MFFISICIRSKSEKCFCAFQVLRRWRHCKQAVLQPSNVFRQIRANAGSWEIHAEEEYWCCQYETLVCSATQQSPQYSFTGNKHKYCSSPLKHFGDDVVVRNMESANIMGFSQSTSRFWWVPTSIPCSPCALRHLQRERWLKDLVQHCHYVWKFWNKKDQK